MEDSKVYLRHLKAQADWALKYALMTQSLTCVESEDSFATFQPFTKILSDLTTIRHIRELKQTAAMMSTRMSPNKSFNINEQNSSCA